MAPGIAVTNEYGRSWTDVSLLDRLLSEMAQESILKEDQSLREHDLLVDHRQNKHNHSKKTALQASLSLLSDEDPLVVLLKNGGEVLQKIASGLKQAARRAFLQWCQSWMQLASLHQISGQLKNTSKLYADTLIGKALLELLQKSSRWFEAALSCSLPALSAC